MNNVRIGGQNFPATADLWERLTLEQVGVGVEWAKEKTDPDTDSSPDPYVFWLRLRCRMKTCV